MCYLKNASFLHSVFVLIWMCFTSCGGVPPEKDMVISQSMKLEKGSYFINSYDTLQSVITVTGNNIIVDFQHLIIEGDSNHYNPDNFTGVGIHIVDGSNITIKNLIIRGFKVGILAEDIQGLVIENSDFSYNYRPRLKSIREREDLSDWLSYHDNENDEWLRYGAGIYLKNCDNAVIKNNRCSQNQNALLMTLCDSSEVYNNIFAFNSGLGLGMYRSTYNSVKHNCFDFNIRGYSHDFYRRGQDSAGILCYEQCSHNVFAYNSATHSGDGFFLWAGNSTMDSGEGGSNNNIIAFNDFSYAPTNGIEVTFSSNIIIGNKLVDCRYGVWGGYSHHTIIIDNVFERNNYGVAIEHGNNNIISFNDFNGDEVGIQLWERETQPPDWGFAQNRDVSSRDYVLAENKFYNVDKIYDVRKTSGIDTILNNESLFESPVALKNGINAENIIHYKGREKMLINEWGPYNYNYPLIWLNGIIKDTFHFNILGPTGKWHIKETKGFSEISSNTGKTGDKIWGLRNLDEDMIHFVLEYNGDDFIDQHGIKKKGENYTFSYDRYDKSIQWSVSWSSFNEKTHPLNNYSAFKKHIRTKQEYRQETNDLAYTWWRSPGNKIDPERFGTFAKSVSRFNPGKYLIHITSDDGLRFFIDGKLRIDNWNIHVPTTDSLYVDLNGEHLFELEHFEGGGFSTLDFRLSVVQEY